MRLVNPPKWVASVELEWLRTDPSFAALLFGLRVATLALALMLSLALALALMLSLALALALMLSLALALALMPPTPNPNPQLLNPNPNPNPLRPQGDATPPRYRGRLRLPRSPADHAVLRAALRWPALCHPAPDRRSVRGRHRPRASARAHT